MDRTYWDNLEGDYEESIHHVLAEDRGGVVVQRVRDHADPEGIAIDFGCGTGRALPLLAECFGTVQAYDLSSGLLHRAQEIANTLPNTTVACADLATSNPIDQAADFILCINVMITSKLDVRRGLWEQLALSLRPGGHAVIVVPAIEAIHLAGARLLEWNLAEGAKSRDAESTVKRILGERFHSRPELGLMELEGVATKHYSAEELEITTRNHHLELLTLDKVEYDWTTEFAQPPDWMGAPYPWDWSLVVRRST